MCGIAGYRGVKPVERELDRMLSMINHRGPNEVGTYVDPSIALGNSRLAIIDIPDGQQPFRDEATGTVISSNGEIFNYVELREQLEKRGHRFRTHSDTEVVLRLYLEEGENFPQQLNGQFAISIWDPRQSKLILARDRFGICPLFYYHANESFYFASEMKALLAHPQVPRKLNLEALDQIFTFWTAVAGHTPLQEIYELMPGNLLVLRPGASPTISTYWDWPFPQNQTKSTQNFEDAKSAFLDELRQSVRLRLRADIEVSSYLSGGIDSSAIAALATQASGGRLSTYSIGFEDETYDETPFQQQVVQRYGTRHTHVLCKTEDIAHNFENIIWHTESPLFRTAPSPMSHLSQQVKKSGRKVVLTGEGADEVLLGYDVFREVKVRRFWSRQPESASRPKLLKKLYAYLPQFANSRYAALAVQSFRGTLESDSPFYSHLIRWDNNAANKVYYSPQLQHAATQFDAVGTLSRSLPMEFFSVGDVDRAQYLELTTLLRGYLLSSQGDRMLMSNSVEGRFPFLDHRFVELVNSLPQSHKLRGLNDKRILRESMKDLLPAEICHRSKFAYQAPELRAFLRVDDNNSELVDKFLSPGAIRETGLFSESHVELLLKKAKASNLSRLGTRDNMAFVQMLSTQIFHQKFITDDLQSRADDSVRTMKVKTRLYGPKGSNDDAR